MSDDIDQIREAYRALDEGQPTDLIGRLEARIRSGLCYYDKADEALDREAAARIRELESLLATAEADALERAEPHLAEIDDVAEWINSTLPIPTSGATKMLGKLLDATAAIRSLKPKASE